MKFKKIKHRISLKKHEIKNIGRGADGYNFQNLQVSEP